MSYPPPPGSHEPNGPNEPTRPSEPTGPPPPPYQFTPPAFPPPGPPPGPPVAGPGQQPYAFTPPPANSGKAVVSLVLGIIALLMCGLFLGIPAMVLAWQAKREIRESNGAVGGEGLATAGFITGLIGTLWSLLAVAAVIGLFAFGGPIIDEFEQSCVTTQAPDGSFSVECS